MGNHNGSKDLEMNVLVCGEYLTYKYNRVLLGNTDLQITTFKKNNITFARSIHPSLKWIFDIYEDEFTIDKINILTSYIEGNYNANFEKNVLICLVTNLDSELPHEIIRKFAEQCKIYHPFIVFIVKDNFNIETIYSFIDDNHIKFDKRNIYAHRYRENNSNDVYLSLLRICSYYNELGDSFNFPINIDPDELIDSSDDIPPDNSAPITPIGNAPPLEDKPGEKDEEPKKDEKEKKNYIATFNIMIAGRPGVGKSTLINILLGEKKCREGAGRTKTSKIVKYIHKDYPLALYDTPGFDSEKEEAMVTKLIKEYNEDLVNGRNQIHAMFFLINSESSRTFVGKDANFIMKIKSLNIPIYFLLTRCQTKKKGDEFKDILKISLKQIFKDTSFMDNTRIYPVQLIPEGDENSEIKIEPFGLGEVLHGLHDDFWDDRINLNFFDGVKNDDEKRIKEIISKSRFFKFIQTIDDVVIYSKSMSKKIIGSYCLLAGAIGASPLPIADWFLLTPIQVSMVMAIAGAFGRFKNKEDALSIVKSMGVNLAVSGVARGVASGVKAIPGIGTIIGVVLDVTFSSSATLAMGYSCMKIFEKELRDAGSVAYIKDLAECYNRAIDGFHQMKSKFN